MKATVLPFAVIVALSGCATQRDIRRPRPTDTLTGGVEIPPAIYQAFESGKNVDNMGQTPVVFIGKFDRVDSKPHQTPFGDEWSAIITVKKVLLGTYPEKIWLYGTSAPSRVPFAKGKEYFFVTTLGRHGNVLLRWLPVSPEPNKAPEPTPPSVTPRASEEVSK